MKRLLILSFLLNFQDCYTAQENIQNHSPMNFRAKLIKELNKSSTKYLLATIGSQCAGSYLNSLAVDGQGTPFVVANTVVAGLLIGSAYLVASQEEYNELDVQCSRVINHCCACAMLGFGVFFEENVVYHCPMLSNVFTRDCTIFSGALLPDRSQTIAEFGAMSLFILSGLLLNDVARSLEEEHDQDCTRVQLLDDLNQYKLFTASGEDQV